MVISIFHILPNTSASTSIRFLRQLIYHCCILSFLCWNWFCPNNATSLTTSRLSLSTPRVGVEVMFHKIEVSSQLQDCSVLYYKKAPPTSIQQEAGWATEQVWTFRTYRSRSIIEYLIFQYKIFTKIPSITVGIYVRSDGQRSAWQRTELKQINSKNLPS